MPWLIGLLFLIPTLYLVVIYNRLVKTSNIQKEAWSGIDVQLKRRSELIPNLVEAVRGYSEHEQSVLVDVVQKRTMAMDAQGTQAKGLAENALSAGLRDLFVLAEAYPDLKASSGYLTLQKELVQVEDQIQLARRYYNGAVRMLNNLIETFPSNIVAKLTGFSKGEFFTIELATEREVPDISWAKK